MWSDSNGGRGPIKTHNLKLSRAVRGRRENMCGK
jgi:hypothetical protein